jgi:hypothetical protein
LATLWADRLVPRASALACASKPPRPNEAFEKRECFDPIQSGERAYACIRQGRRCGIVRVGHYKVGQLIGRKPKPCRRLEGIGQRVEDPSALSVLCEKAGVSEPLQRPSCFTRIDA